MQPYDIVIAGAGPAGISTALSLQKIAPDLAARAVVLEKARHPRPKLCGGGVTLLADPVMQWLGIGWERLAVPHVPIHAVRLRFAGQEVTLRLPNLFRIVRRNEFDARLVAMARARGIEVWEEAPVIGLARDDEGVTVQTPGGALRARVVVGADGAKSVIRRWMGLPPVDGPSRVARLLEVLTPEDAGRTPEFRENYAVFDFSPVPFGVQGYLWDFPSYVDGRPMMNRGVFDARLLTDRPRPNLAPVLDAHLQRQQRSLANCELQGHPLRTYDPQGVYAVPHVFLVGDAAGVDPLLGEGIAWALRYGPVAAREVQAAFATGDFSFAAYSRRLAASDVGRGLAQRAAIARFVYRRSRRFIRLAWPLLGPFSRYLAWRAASLAASV